MSTNDEWIFFDKDIEHITNKYIKINWFFYAQVLEEDKCQENSKNSWNVSNAGTGKTSKWIWNRRWHQRKRSDGRAWNLSRIRWPSLCLFDLTFEHEGLCQATRTSDRQLIRGSACYYHVTARMTSAMLNLELGLSLHLFDCRHRTIEPMSCYYRLFLRQFVTSLHWDVISIDLTWTDFCSTNGPMSCSHVQFYLWIRDCVWWHLNCFLTMISVIRHVNLEIVDMHSLSIWECHATMSHYLNVIWHRIYIIDKVFYSGSNMNQNHTGMALKTCKYMHSIIVSHNCVWPLIFYAQVLEEQHRRELEDISDVSVMPARNKFEMNLIYLSMTRASTCHIRMTVSIDLLEMWSYCHTSSDRQMSWHMISNEAYVSTTSEVYDIYKPRTYRTAHYAMTYRWLYRWHIDDISMTYRWHIDDISMAYITS